MTRQQEPLSWWLCLDGCRYQASVHGGIYVVIYHRNKWGGADHWNAKHQRGRKVRQLGVTKTLEQAKALAQADYEQRLAAKS